MAKESIGEPILLVWDGWPDAFFVKGHLAENEAIEALNREELLEEADYRNWYKPLMGPAIHCFARWSTEPGPEGCTQVLRNYSEGGRGRFAVTMFRVARWEKTASPVYKPRELTI